MNFKVNILSYWESDYGDVKCNAVIEKDNKKGNIIVSFEKPINYEESTDSDKRNWFAVEVLKGIDSYLELPKISECCPLLQDIYKGVAYSDSEMFHLSDEDWEECYKDKFNEHDINLLSEDIEKYNLQEVITLNDMGYKIIGWGDLPTRFNDDLEEK